MSWFRLKWFLVGVAIAFVTLQAFADPGKGEGKGHGHDDGSQSGSPVAVAGAAAGAASQAVSSAGAVSGSVSVSTGGDGGTGGSASATGGAGGSSSVTNNVSLFGGGAGGASSQSGADGSVIIGQTNITQPDDIKIRNTPEARAPFSNSTGPCIVGRSAAFSFPGGSVGGGSGFEDKECTRRQSAETWSNMGLPAMGLWLMCRSEDMARTGATPEDCDAMVVQMQEQSVIDLNVGNYVEDSPGK